MDELDLEIVARLSDIFSTPQNMDFLAIEKLVVMTGRDVQVVLAFSSAEQ